jgi:hypothetical protein
MAEPPCSLVKAFTGVKKVAGPRNAWRSRGLSAALDTVASEAQPSCRRRAARLTRRQALSRIPHCCLNVASPKKVGSSHHEREEGHCWVRIGHEMPARRAVRAAQAEFAGREEGFAVTCRENVP